MATYFGLDKSWWSPSQPQKVKTTPKITTFSRFHHGLVLIKTSCNYPFARSHPKLTDDRDPGCACGAWGRQAAKGVGCSHRRAPRLEGQIRRNLHGAGADLQWNVWILRGLVWLYASREKQSIFKCQYFPIAYEVIICPCQNMFSSEAGPDFVWLFQLMFVLVKFLSSLLVDNKSRPNGGEVAY